MTSLSELNDSNDDDGHSSMGVRSLRARGQRMGRQSSRASSTDVSLPNLGGISFQSAKALIKREIVNPPTSHIRTKDVFDGHHNSDHLSRPDTVIIAQLRIGHCRKLAAYRSVVDANS